MDAEMARDEDDSAGGERVVALTDAAEPWTQTQSTFSTSSEDAAGRLIPTTDHRPAPVGDVVMTTDQTTAESSLHQLLQLFDVDDDGDT